MGGFSSVAPPINLLFVFLLSLCYLLCVPVYASSNTPSGEVNDKIFKLNEKINNVQEHNASGKVQGGISLKGINLPLFLFAAKNNAIVAIAEANYLENNEDDSKAKVDLVAKYFETKSADDWSSKIITNAGNGWKAQLATKGDGEQKAFSTIMAFTVNANADKIYVFLLNITDTTSKNKLNLTLVKGVVNAGEGDSIPITWNTKKTFESLSIKKIFNKKEETSLIAGDGSVFSISDNEILIVVKGEISKTSNSGSESVTSYFKLERVDSDYPAAYEIKTIAGWYSFFQWNGNIFKTPTKDPKCANNKVMVFDEATNTFDDSKEPIVRLRDFLKDKNNFATAQIEGTDVLLFTQQKSKGGASNAYLWMTDGTRVGYAGIIESNFKGTFYGSLLHTKNELFALYQTYETGSGSSIKNNKVYFALLKKQLNNMKTTLNAWNENNKKIKNIFKETDTTTTSSFTDGLVGFLSVDDKNSDSWTDEYFNVNATVTKKENAEKVQDGFKLNGKGAGIKWPVKKEDEDYPYNFTDAGFTLVATVEIDRDANNTNSVLGVGLQNKNNVGLWCGDGEWAVKVGEGDAAAKENQKKCNQGKKYIIAFVLEDRNLEIYVDGDKLTALNENKMKIERTDIITHFYFGVDDSTQHATSDMTITNVLLYNRPFVFNEINKLKIIAKRNNEQSENKNTRNSDKNTIENDWSSDTSTTEKDEAEIKLCLRSMNIITVLLFLFFGVFTSLGRYVY